MGKINRYSPEVRDRAIRMVTDHRGEYASQWAAIQSVSQKLGMTEYSRISLPPIPLIRFHLFQ